MARPQRRKIDLIEEVAMDTAPTVDREAGVIRGVKVLGKISKNKGREYTDNALREAAGMYEQCGVNLNHPDRKTPEAERSVQEKIGWLESIQVKGDGVYGDLHYIKSHPFSEALCEMAERNPRQLGMSHNAAGVFKRSGQKVLIESIEKVRSIDLVQKPATTCGLFESEESDMPKNLKSFVESIESDSPLKSCLLNLLEEDPAMAAMDAPEMPDAPTGQSSEDQIKAAFRQAVMAAFDDESLDSKATLSKIKDILKAYDKLTGSSSGSSGSTGSDAGSSDAGGGDAMESLQAEIKSLKAKDGVRDLLESEGVQSTPERVAALVNLDLSARKTLVATFKKADSSESTVRPRKPSSRSILESQEESPLDYSERAKVPLAKRF